MLHNYGMLLHTKIGNHDKAETLYRRALQVNIAALPAAMLTVASSTLSSLTLCWRMRTSCVKCGRITRMQTSC